MVQLDRIEDFEAIEAAIEGSTWAPEHLDKSIPTPQGLDFVTWSRTVVTMPKFRARGFSFKEMAQQACVETEVKEYLLFIAKYGTPDALATTMKDGALCFLKEPKTQGVDLAAFLKAIRFETHMGRSDHGGYKREFKK